ncbi:hydroxyethylthiazole kinase [Petrotoga halophila]|uniref:Hydroxyethylthiazole kinase n=1 Tax=Petrotoga halophila DSM 16923 TaxID=1122953 RepID=A0A2S5E943_9BACT|nr:hydroxyethylthiazole kinase [Petrotoga halophila]POZ89612.1 hydroxyethylthiazole kinase [Petrotoga halophila DSM 16923]
MVNNILDTVKVKKPLIHHITNMVTINDCANVTLAVGGLPVMAHAIEEVEEMVSNSQALVLNIGTLTLEQVKAMIKAGKKANSLNIPVIFDPVGAGATKIRTDASKKILDEVQISVIKGNKAEIGILTGSGGKIRGVEAESNDENIESYKNFAKEYHCIVAASGATDIVSDGNTVYKVDNGHSMLGTISGTGCMLTSVIANFCAVEIDYLQATVSAMVAFGLAGELAASRSEVKGPASFKEAFFDEIYNLTDEKLSRGIKVRGEVN